MTEQDLLLASWRAASTQGSTRWSDGDEWWTPAVEALADALSGQPIDAALAGEALGRQRAAAGIFLDSARRDVVNAATVAGCSSIEAAALVDAVTLGWVDRTLDDYFTSVCVDPLTELASLPYLLTRLSEVYAEAVVEGGHPNADYALVVVRTAQRSDPIEVETALIAVQVALRLAFRGGETVARIGPQCAVALCRRTEPRFGRSLALLRDELGVARFENRLPGVRVWIESLPVWRDDLPALLRDVNSDRR